MKLIISAIGLGLFLTAGVTVFAQNAHETTIKFNKEEASAVVADYNRPEDVIETAVERKLESEGLIKSKSSKGFKIFTGVLWNRVGNDKVDVYYKVEGKKNKASVTIMVSKGYNNFLNSNTDQSSITSIKSFLNDLEIQAKSVQFGLDINAQEEIARKAEKEYQRSASDSSDLEKQRVKLEQKIAENNTLTQNRQKALDAERQKLSAMKAQVQ